MAQFFVGLLKFTPGPPAKGEVGEGVFTRAGGGSGWSWESVGGTAWQSIQLPIAFLRAARALYGPW